MAVKVDFFAFRREDRSTSYRSKKAVSQLITVVKEQKPVFSPQRERKDGPFYFSEGSFYPKNEINTPAATAEPITPEILLAMQY